MEALEYSVHYIRSTLDPVCVERSPTQFFRGQTYSSTNSLRNGGYIVYDELCTGPYRAYSFLFAMNKNSVPGLQQDQSLKNKINLKNFVLINLSMVYNTQR
jgi:hypothetical protein